MTRLIGTKPNQVPVNGMLGEFAFRDSLAKNDVGLGNVDNTSDANKPISTATQNALNGKQDTLVSGTNIKTVNGLTILGSGDVTISASSEAFSAF